VTASLISRGLQEIVSNATCRAVRNAELYLPPDVTSAIMQAFAREKNPVAKKELENILENIRRAEERSVPLCQDTGIPVVYLTVPPEVPFCDDLCDGIREGIRMATDRVPLRPNVVDPITRENSGINTGERMPGIHVRPGRELSVTVLPKGAGAENMSRITMLLPTGRHLIGKFVAETVLLAGGRPCPPVILGVGIGGSFDQAASMAKEALLLQVDRMDLFEQQLCDTVNRLGIGPMGLGGDTTALAVKVKKAGCHTASLPVAVNVQCWASRRATEVIDL